MAVSAATTASSTGVDVNAIVTGLMAIERQPITKLTTKVNNDQAKLSSLGLIKSQMVNFQTAVQGLDSSSTSSLSTFNANSSDSTVLSASADSSAVAGTYTINVTTLAQAHKLAAAGQSSDTAAISAVASTATFTIGTTSTDISIAAGASLQDIRAAINSANIGVTATIVNDGSASPYRLALSSDNTGTINAISSITVQTGGDTSVNDLLAYNATANVPVPAVPMAQTVAAQNADFTVNGIQISKASNSVTDAIQGVTLNLSKQATSATLTVNRDTAAVTDKVTAFVKSYNDMYTALKTSTAYKANQALEGDASLRSLQTQLRSIAGESVSGGTMTKLSEIGISFTAGGVMTLDTTKLSSAMTTNFSDVANLFNSSTGYATKFYALTKDALASDGTFATRTTNIKSKMTTTNNQIDTLNMRMSNIEKRYRTLYSSLNVMLVQMSQTSQYLTRQLG